MVFRYDVRTAVRAGDSGGRGGGCQTGFDEWTFRLSKGSRELGSRGGVEWEMKLGSRLPAGADGCVAYRTRQMLPMGKLQVINLKAGVQAQVYAKALAGKPLCGSWVYKGLKISKSIVHRVYSFSEPPQGSRTNINSKQIHLA